MGIRTVIWAIGYCFVLGTSAYGEDPVGGIRTQESREVLVSRIRDAVRSADMSSVDAISKEIEESWRNVDVEVYAGLIRTLCDELSGQAAPTSREYGLSQALAIRALDDNERISLETELGLIEKVRQSLDREGHRVSGLSWVSLRDQQTSLWLHGLRRIERLIDPKWDSNDAPPVHPIPSRRLMTVPAGADPASIQDPVLRAEYQQALEENRQKAAHFDQQYRARRLLADFRIAALQYLTQAYTIPPIDIVHLDKVLQRGGADPDFAGDVLNAVKKGLPPSDRSTRASTRVAPSALDR